MVRSGRMPLAKRLARRFSALHPMQRKNGVLPKHGMPIRPDSSDGCRHLLVASLNRPAGNLTGVTNLNVEVGPKRLELLRELLPSATIIALLVNPTSPAIAEPASAPQPAP